MNTEKNQLIWIDKIQENLILRGRSQRTFKNYKSALNKFFNFYDNKTNIKKFNEIDIVEYLKINILDKNMCTDTYNMSVSAIRLLFILCFNKELNRLLLPNCKFKKRIPTIIPKDFFIKIFNEEKSIRHKCWLLLGFCSGLRVDEVAKLKIENIFSNNHKIKIIGKGNKERYTVLPDITIKFLRLYCIKYNIKCKAGYLFTSHIDAPVPSSDTIVNYFSNLMKKYNHFNKYTFHSLRHSFATYYLSNGGSLLALQSMLGHTNLNTTTIYLHLSQNFNELEGIKYV